MYDVLIIGSGISGVSAALRFADLGINTCIIDVGLEPCKAVEINENFYDYRNKNDCFDLMIGEDFEGLYNLDKNKKSIPAKLTAPNMKFVMDRSEVLSPVREKNFQLIQSFAQGGLANAWGAGLMRYNKRDLRNFPISENELIPYYERLTKEIGISGENDDLTPYFGKDAFLQKPLKLSLNASEVLKRYFRKRRKLNKKGAYIGRPRLAILSEDKNQRRAWDYSNLEFWQPHLSSIYYPSLTLNKLIKRGNVIYKKGFLAKLWFRQNNSIVVKADSLQEKKTVFFKCKKLILAAGAVGSAKLALASRNDYQSKLILLDNTALQFPFLLPGRIGKELEIYSLGLTQLNFIFDSEVYNGLFQGSILEITSPARAEFFSYFPLAAMDNLRLVRYILPAMLVMQLYLPTFPDRGASLYLTKNDELEIIGKKIDVNKDLIKDIVKIFRMLGAYTLPSLVVKVSNGLAIHYAGTLPMVNSPKRLYQCSKFGELFGEPNVYVVDGSLFPELSSKNYSFAVMANAMRIADYISKT